MIKADLHVHSRYSERPANWLARQFSIPESFTDPLHIYHTARARGMTHVTLTDHNTINGCLHIAHLPDTFISCEFTARFPEDQCKVHVLTYHITEQQFQDLVTIRQDLYEMVRYLDAHLISNAIAHPLYSVNNKLTQAHFEKLLLLFDLIELNGFRSPEVNEKLRATVASLTHEQLETLADKHHIDNPKIDPRRKYHISGSDDHSGLFVARSHTANPGDNPLAFFTHPELSEANPTPSEPTHLAYAIYSILYQHIEKKVNIGRYLARNEALRHMSQLLTMKKPDSPSALYSLLMKVLGARRRRKNNTELLLRKTLKRMPGITRNLTAENAPQRWFTMMSTTVDENVRDLLDYTIEQLKMGNVFNIINGIGSISSLYVLSIPYYIAYKSFQDTRQFAERLSIIESAVRKPRVVHLTDTYYEINGVAKSLQQMALRAKKLGLDYTLVTCAERESLLGEKVFKPVQVFDLPEYPEMKLACPPVLDIIDYCFREDFTHVHSDTPGPVGLAGLLVAKVLNRPFFTTYHTALSQYATQLTGDQSLESFIWIYLRWFYNQANTVFTPSQASRDELVFNGIAPQKVVVMPHGVDTERFTPRDWSKNGDVFKLLYVGRVSKEKNLDVLAQALRSLNREDVRLTIVGDGPYRAELMAGLADLNVDFPGYLEDEALVNAYHDADLFVFPSTTDTFGCVVLESHACAVPTIVTDEGGPHHIVVPGETGIVVPGRDCAALRRSIESMLDRKRLMAMGLRARTLVEAKGFDHAFMEYWKCYERAPLPKNGDSTGNGMSR
jgi:glycosyltransferase involved in cell wall biosynthesis